MPRYFGPAGEIVININGAGEGFIPDEISGQFLLPSGASGDIITLTPPTGKRVRLDNLYANADESGITITVGSETVATSLILGNAGVIMGVGEMKIGATTPPPGGDSSSPYLLTKNSNDTIVITKDSGSTSTSIYYSYSYGD